MPRWTRAGLVVVTAAALLTPATDFASASPAEGLGSPPPQQAASKPIKPLRDFSIRIVEPAPDTLVLGQAVIRAEVSADRIDEVLFVEFEVDGRLLFSDVSAPYELVWRTRELAAHRLVARAYGPAGTVVEDQIATAAPPPVEQAGLFASRVERVELYVHVSEKRDRVGGLSVADFTVLEEGVEQPIVAVERSLDLPLALGFMVDCSGSMVSQLAFALDAADAFIGGLVERQHDKAFVMAFADLPSLLQEFTNDVGRLSLALDLISGAKYTRLYDSVVAATGQFEGHTGRRAVVILTDGHDSNSDTRLSEAIRAAQRADVAIYPVAVGLSPRYFYERWVLERLAKATGGRVLYMDRKDDPSRIYGRIADDLREQYRITYSPAQAGGDGEWRDVEVRVASSRPGKTSKARARPGYFAR